MNGSVKRAAIVLAVAALALGMAPSALGYEGEVANQVSVNAPGNLDCLTTVTVTATVVDSTGKPIEGQPVIWSSGGTTSTDQDGHATTTVAVPVGGTTVSAQADDAQGSAAIGCVLAAIGLPRTDTAPGTPLWSLALALAAVLGGGLFILRRVRG